MTKLDAFKQTVSRRQELRNIGIRELFDYYNEHLDEINLHFHTSPDPLLSSCEVSLNSNVINEFTWSIKISSDMIARPGMPYTSVVFPPPPRITPISEFSEQLAANFKFKVEGHAND